MQRTADTLRAAGRRLCVVPTMGALHEGHLSLIRTAKSCADVVITTIFVNPTQFAKGEDFGRYPRTLESDVALASEAGSDYIFAPVTAEMYHPDHLTFVTVDRMADVLEGESRPGHFRGVTTVVAKLFNITKPHVAVFGQKDAQQVVLVRRLIRDLSFDIQLIVAPIVRESDGLAMSSRNIFLTPDERRQAGVLFQALRLAGKRLQEGERSSTAIIRDMGSLIKSNSSGVVDYISIADSETLDEIPVCASGRPLLVSLAVRFGSTRLIDNVLIAL